MAGHSKWANIQHRKKAQDAKRGKLFTRLIREISVAARHGGGDPAANPRLRLAVDKARQANMPKDNIERAIAKGTGDDGGEAWEEVVYEGYGPGGTAILLEGLTDNRNRTVGEVRHVLSKHGGNLGQPGCVSYLFDKRGVLEFAREGLDADALLEAALDAGALDVEEGEELLRVVCDPAALGQVRAALEGRGFEPVRAEVTLEASSTVELVGDDALRMLRLADALEDLDDVQAVHANFDVPDEVMAQLAS